MCQRNVTQHFPQLQGLEAELQRRIGAFFDRHILATYAAETPVFSPCHAARRFPLQRYTADVYVASDSDAVRLIDFNPVGGTTVPLLFTWEELGLQDGQPHTQTDAAFPVRIVTDPMGIQPDKAAYMVPYDFVDDGPGGAAEDIWQRLQNLQSLS